jgi:hypothetical protein
VFLITFLLSPEEPDGVGCSKHSGDDFQEFVLSEEVQDFVAGKSDYLSNEGAAELNKFEDMSKAFVSRQHGLKDNAAPEISQGGSAVHSITPKVQPHKTRIKKPSHFMQSPYDGLLRVTAEQDEVYEKILLSSMKQRSSKSSIKKYVFV